MLEYVGPWGEDRAGAEVTGPAVLMSAAFVAATTSGYEIRQELLRRTPQPDGSVRARRERMTVFLAGRRARIAHEDGTATIVRLRSEEMLEVDDLLKCYERKTFDGLRRQWRMLNALLLEQIEGAPPGHPRRAELIDQLTDGPAKWQEIWRLPPGGPRERLLAKYRLPERSPRIEVRTARETKEIGGQECRRYASLEDGKVVDWAYLAAGIRLHPGYYEFMELAGWIGPDLAKGLKRARLLPLESVVHMRDGREIELRTISVAPRELDPSLFEIPEGYTERKAKPGFR